MLSSLTPRDALLLAPALKRVMYEPGDMLSLGDENFAEYAYFPETLTVCLLSPGCNSSVGLIGREGVIGWDGLFGSTPNHHRGLVQLGGGSALTVACDKLLALTFASPTLALSLARFVQTFTIQMSLTIRSALHDTVEARLGAWLLMLHDRVDGDELLVTHHALASQLNLRRATVTDAMHRLEGERALRCTRGRIVIRDRAMLEAQAGKAYGVPEHAYRVVFGAFGKSQAPVASPGQSAISPPCSVALPRSQQLGIQIRLGDARPFVEDAAPSAAPVVLAV